jgi:hypothetical protein
VTSRIDQHRIEGILADARYPCDHDWLVQRMVELRDSQQ